MQEKNGNITQISMFSASAELNSLNLGKIIAFSFILVQLEPKNEQFNYFVITLTFLEIQEHNSRSNKQITIQEKKNRTFIQICMLSVIQELN